MLVAEHLDHLLRPPLRDSPFQFQQYRSDSLLQQLILDHGRIRQFESRRQLLATIGNRPYKLVTLALGSRETAKSPGSGHGLRIGDDRSFLEKRVQLAAGHEADLALVPNPQDLQAAVDHPQRQRDRNRHPGLGHVAIGLDDRRLDRGPLKFVDSSFPELRAAGHHDLLAGEGDQHPVSLERIGNVGNRANSRVSIRQQRIGDFIGRSERTAFPEPRLARGNQFENQRGSPLVNPIGRIEESLGRPFEPGFDRRGVVRGNRERDPYQSPWKGPDGGLRRLGNFLREPVGKQ